MKKKTLDQFAKISVRFHRLWPYNNPRDFSFTTFPMQLKRIRLRSSPSASNCEQSHPFFKSVPPSDENQAKEKGYTCELRLRFPPYCCCFYPYASNYLYIYIYIYICINEMSAYVRVKTPDVSQ